MRAKYYGYISMMCSMLFVYVIFMVVAAAFAIGEIESGEEMDIELSAGLMEMQSTFASFPAAAIMPLVAGLAVLAAFLLVGSMAAGFKAYSN